MQFTEEELRAAIANRQEAIRLEIAARAPTPYGIAGHMADIGALQKMLMDMGISKF